MQGEQTPEIAASPAPVAEEPFVARQHNRRWPKLPVILVRGFGDEPLRKPFTRGAPVESLRRHLDDAHHLTA